MKKMFKQIFKKMFLAAILAVFFLAGCQKEQLKSTSKIVVKGSHDWEFPETLNWEDPSLNNMPYPYDPLQNAITVPWIGGGSLESTVEPDVLSDRRASDGWVLVYNTFTNQKKNPDPYFVLYNKYRGLMRIFIYLNTTTDVSQSSYLKDAITANYHSFLNFANSEIVDVSQIQNRIDNVQHYPKDNSDPYSRNKWYMLQYEMAYDPTLVPTLSDNPPKFSFYINSINIDSVNLGGTSQGKLNGTVGSSSPSNTNLFSSVTNLMKPIGTGVLSALGQNFLNNHSVQGEAGSNNLGLLPTTFNSISTGLNNAVTSAANQLPGAVINLLSAIIGGSSASTQQTVSLNLSTTISLKGSIVGSQNIIAPTAFYMPGSVQADANGNYNVPSYVPLYNQPLGVFNLLSRPTVYIHRNGPSPINTDYGRYYEYQDSYSKNDGDINSLITFNPSVINSNMDGATITNLTSEIVLFNPRQLGAEGVGELADYFWGRLESYKDRDMYTSKSGIYINFVTVRPWLLQSSVAVRISFNVVPNNGGPISTIVKTFVPNIVIQ